MIKPKNAPNVELPPHAVAAHLLILTINGGSSSIKFALFEAGDSLRRILTGGIERIGLPEATLRVKGLDQADNFVRSLTAPNHTVAVGTLMDWIEQRSGRDALTAVGHRVVHGGPKYSEPQHITAEMVEELHLLSPYNPEHLPKAILLTEAFHRKFSGLPQVACFDTAFHHDLPRVARLLPIPRRYEAQGVRRYGFHGLSYSFLMRELACLAGTEAAQGRIILAHLGNGASLAAVRDGRSIDTSMGFTHQDPGFLDHVVNKKAEFIRVYLPPDANTLLSVTDHCLRSRNYVNVVVAGKQPSPQWLSMNDAERHCTAGLGIWKWASNDDGGVPEVVMACCGDVPTIETPAAVDLMRCHLPDVKVRVVNVVNLMKLQSSSEHPHGLSDDEFDAMFTRDRQIIFAFHGYPSLIHQLTYRRSNHTNLHVRGFKEEGTTTTPFDMVVLNDMDRFHLVCDVIDRVPGLATRAADVRQTLVDKRAEHTRYIAEHGEDMPEIRHWKWNRAR